MTARPPPWTAFWQSVVSFQADKISPWLALRNTLGIAIPLIAGIALGSVSGGLAMSTGALNVAFSDSHDPYLQRGRKMLVASALVALAVFAGSLSGWNSVVAILLATGWAFGAGMMVALSTAAADVGAVSLVTLVVYSAFPQPTERALMAGLLALAGGLLQVLLSLAFWPLHRYMHQQLVLGDLYNELARAATVPIQATAAPPASAQSAQAQSALASLDRDHSVEGERYRLLLSQAERIRLSLLMLGRLRTRMQREDQASPEGRILGRFLEIYAHMLSSIGSALRENQPASVAWDDLWELERLAERLRGPNESAAPPMSAWSKDARFQMDALVGQIRSAIDLATSATSAGLQAFERRESSRPWTLRLGGTWATLRANLSLKSAACRHAIRLAACLAAGDVLARGVDLQRSYWLPMTIAIVLKPDFTATFSRGLLRLIGTFAGLLLATVLFHVLHPVGFEEVALIAALMFIMRWIGPANYGILVVAVTALVVFLVAMTGAAPKELIAARAMNTVAGGVIALLAYWVWPTWERTQVSEAIAQMLDAYRESFRAIRSSHEVQIHGTRDASLTNERERTRLASRLARSNLEASIDRLSVEPGTSAATMSVLGAVLASSHRYVHAIMALEAGLSGSQAVPAPEAFRSFANQVELTLYYLAAALRGSPIEHSALPDLREAHRALARSGDLLADRHTLVNVETDRITNSLNTLSEDLLRWIGSESK